MERKERIYFLIIAVIIQPHIYCLFCSEVMVIESYQVKHITMIDGDRHPRWRSNFKRTEVCLLSHMLNLKSCSALNVELFSHGRK